MPEIRIIAEMRFKPGQKKDLMPALDRLVEGSRAERGNISYEVLESLEDPDHLFVVERWASAEAIAEHNKTDHFQDFMKLAQGKTDENKVIKLKKVM